MIEKIISGAYALLSAHSIVCICIMLASSLIAAFSQILLKKSAGRAHKKGIYEYLNVYVIVSYGLLAFTMFANMVAYWGVEYKLGVILGTSSYLFIMLLGRLFLKEKITKRKLIGTLMIVAGIIIFSVF